MPIESESVVELPVADPLEVRMPTFHIVVIVLLVKL